MYACDRRYWEIKRPEFAGLKVSGQQTEFAYCMGVKNIDRMVFDGSGIGGGGNSAFQAINCAVLWGSKKIILTGVDLKGGHWHEQHGSGLANPTESTFRRWNRAFSEARSQLDYLGVVVVNCSPDSDLDAFKRMSLERALSWAKGK